MKPCFAVGVMVAVLFSGLVAVGPPALAGTFKLPEKKPLVSLTIPDSWKPEMIDKGVEGQSADGGVFLSAEITRTEKDMNSIIDDTLAMLKESKVTLSKASRKETKSYINGLAADELLYEGKDERGPTTVSITFVSVKDAVLVFTYWVTPEGEKQHEQELNALVQSIKAVD